MEIQQAIAKIKKLKIDKAHGLAPHKPILLLSLIQGIEINLIFENKLFITPELVSLFKSNWSALVKSKHECRFSLPFYHLISDGFWLLKPNVGYENILLLKNSMKSFNQLNAAVSYALFTEEFYDILSLKQNRDVLRQEILDTYFTETKNNFICPTNHYFTEIESKLVSEDAEQYITEIKTLKINLSQENFEEEIFIRGGAFKREISKIYNNTCCISGMKIDAVFSVSMIDACHIIPFSESYNDTITNGIALCPNLHRAFDRGLISINENFKVIISNKFVEENSVFSIRNFDGNNIIIPKQKNLQPLQSNFEWHNLNIFKS